MRRGRSQRPRGCPARARACGAARGGPRARALLAAVLGSALLLAPAPPAATAGGPSTGRHASGAQPTLSGIEHQLMCVTCKIPLPEAQSPQASRERALISSLIARGQSEAQIKRALRAEYGPAVFALPSSGGFDLAVYVVPPAAVLLALLALALALPRWRRRARGRHDAWSPAPAPALSDADAARLERDLARFEP
jgi:cytochrome c-type biogenesis protein CcmH/NrfF